MDNKLRKKEWIVCRSQSRYWQALVAYIDLPRHMGRLGVAWYTPAAVHEVRQLPKVVTLSAICCCCCLWLLET